jgi:hypothetical protein
MSLWAQARYDLGLTEEEFWRMTPRQLSALLKRHKREHERQEFLFAQVVSNTVNFSMCRPKQPVTPKQFMPSQWRKKESQPQILERLRTQFRAAALEGQKHMRNPNAKS